jgi:glycosyltransferase involved in cell wall biosynthesis
MKCTEFDHQIRSKCFIVPHCFDPEYFTSQPDDRVSDVLDFSYIGSFYGRRNPFSLIKAFDLFLSEHKLDGKIRLNFIGNISPEIIVKMGLENRPWIKIHGPVTYMNSIKSMSQSNFLVLVDMPDDNNLFTPSKLIDYLASKKPILGLTNSKSNSAQIIMDLHCPVVDPADIKGIKDVLKIFVENKNFFSEEEHLKKISKYDANKVISSLANILKGAI